MRIVIVLLILLIAGLRFYGITHVAYQAVAHGFVFSLFSLSWWTWRHPVNRWYEACSEVVDDYSFFLFGGLFLTAVEVYCAWPLITAGLHKLGALLAGQ